MKKIVLFIILFFISKTFAQGNNEFTRISKKNNLTKEVKVFRLDSLNFYLLTHTYYNKFGNLIEDILYHEDGTIWADELYQYNEQQQIVSSLEKTRNTISKYKYNKSGNLIEYKRTKADSTIMYHKKIVYNEKNQKEKVFVKKENKDDFYLYENNFYTNDGLCSKKELFNASGENTSTEEFEYDNNRKLIIIYQLIGKKVTTTNNKYNKKGELIKINYSSNISSNNSSNYFLYAFRKLKYDKYGNKIEDITYNSNHRIRDHIKYEFLIFQ